MVHNVSFMGREECLSKPTKKVADKAHEYLSASTFLETTSNKGKQVAEYIGDTAPIGVIKNPPEVVGADKISEAYRAAHGIVG